MSPAAVQTPARGVLVTGTIVSHATTQERGGPLHARISAGRTAGDERWPQPSMCSLPPDDANRQFHVPSSTMAIPLDAYLRTRPKLQAQRERCRAGLKHRQSRPRGRKHKLAAKDRGVGAACTVSLFPPRSRAQITPWSIHPPAKAGTQGNPMRKLPPWPIPLSRETTTPFVGPTMPNSG